MTAPFAAIYEAAHATVRDELDVELTVFEGAIPRALQGVLYRNGPGRFGRGGLPYGHLVDGDGMVTRYAFADGKVRYRNRFVRTEAWLEEEQLGRVRYRGFGTNRPGGVLNNMGRLRLKNTANTNVIQHGGRLLALWEGGLPYALDPVTLETIGPYDYNGVLKGAHGLDNALSGPELPLTAHPRLDPGTGELFGFGVKPGAVTRLMLYRVDRRGRMAPPESVPLDGCYLVHDFVLTKRWRVFFLCPLKLDVARAVLGFGRVVDQLKPAGEQTWVLCVPRQGGEVAWLPTSAAFVYHFANGYDDGEHRIVIEGPRFPAYPRLPSPASRVPDAGCPRACLTRFVLDLARCEVKETPLHPEHSLEMPRVHPAREGRRHRYVWAIGAPAERPEHFLSAVLRYDSERGDMSVRDLGEQLPSEPVPAPRPGGRSEDDGWLLLTSYVPDEDRTHLLVLDASDLSTVARARLPHALPPGFHGSWVQGR